MLVLSPYGIGATRTTLQTPGILHMPLGSPASQNFRVDGKSCYLPIRSDVCSKMNETCSQHDADYCAGFFDGDG
eukprot:1035766-Pyramimonas_sp.AAC.1